MTFNDGPKPSLQLTSLKANTINDGSKKTVVEKLMFLRRLLPNNRLRKYRLL